MATNGQSVQEPPDDLEVRMNNLEDRVQAQNAKLDVSIDALRGDIKMVLERVDSLGAEMRRGFATMRKEYRADHRLLMSVLKDHTGRLRTLERQMKSVLKAKER